MINYLTKLALIDGLKNIRDDKKSPESYPKTIVDYFNKISEKDLTDEIKIIVKDKYAQSKLSQIIIEFISKDFGEIADEYYYGKSKSIKIDPRSHFEKELLSQLENSTYNEISEKAARELYKTDKGKIIIVESPVDLDLSLKTKIRKSYQNEKALNFVVFKVNESILGGIKTYIDGKIVDDSWAEKIEKLEYIGA